MSLNTNFTVILILLFSTMGLAQETQKTKKWEKEVDKVTNRVSEDLLNRRNLVEAETLANEALAKTASKGQANSRRYVKLLNQSSLFDGFAGRYPDAIRKARTALEIMKGSPQVTTNELAFQEGQLGEAFMNAEMLDSAEHYYLSSITKYAVAGSPDTLQWSRNLVSLGNIAVQRNDIRQADSLAKRAYNLQPAALPDNHIERARRLLATGSTALMQGRGTEAREAYRKAIIIYKANGEAGLSGLASIHFNLGLLDHAEGRIDSAYFNALASVRYMEQVHGPNSIQVSQVLDFCGALLATTGRWEEGIAYLLRSNQILKQHFPEGDPKFVGNYGSLGTSYMSNGQYSESLRYFQLFEKANGTLPELHPFRFMGKASMAILYVNLGEAEKAIKYLDEAEDLINMQVQTAPQDLAYYYSALASVKLLAGNYDAAVYASEYCLELQHLFREEPDARIGEQYGKLGEVNFLLGEYGPAISYFRRAVQNFDGSPGGTLNSLISRMAIGNSYLRIGKTDSARIALEELLVRVELLENKNVPLSGQIYDAFGKLELEEGDLDKALTSFLRVKKLYVAMYSPSSLPMREIDAKIGRVYVELGDHERGREVLLSVINGINQTPGYRSDLASVYFNLFKSYSATGNTQQAKAYLDATLSAMVDVPPVGIEPAARRVNMIDNRELMDKLLLRHTEGDPLLQDQLHRLFSICDFLNYDALRESLRESRLQKISGLPPDLLRREELLKVKINSINKRFQGPEASEGEMSSDSIVRMRRELVDANAQLVALHEEATALNSNYASLLARFTPVTPTDIREVIGSDRSLVEFYVTDNHIHAFLVQDTSLKLFTTKIEGTLEDLISDLLPEGIMGYFQLPIVERTNAKEFASTKSYTDAAYNLYQLLIEPLADQIKYDRVVIIANGPLSSLPFDALLSKPVGETSTGRFAGYPFLVRKYAFSYGYSVSVLQERAVESKVTTNRQVLAMAPFAGPTASDSAKKRSESSDNQILPESRTEVENVLEQWEGVALFNEDADLAAFDTLSRNFDILHISTHAAANVTDGDYGYIAFGAAGESDGRLYAADVYDMHFNARMVVLSACQTAVGSHRNGEGIISLSRAFTFSGAESVFATNWKVDDQPTREIITEFYRVLSLGQPKDLALQNAKLTYLNNNSPDAGHPFFWAALLGMGNMNAL